MEDEGLGERALLALAVEHRAVHLSYVRGRGRGRGRGGWPFLPLVVSGGIGSSGGFSSQEGRKNSTGANGVSSPERFGDLENQEEVYDGTVDGINGGGSSGGSLGGRGGLKVSFGGDFIQEVNKGGDELCGDVIKMKTWKAARSDSDYASCSISRGARLCPRRLVLEDSLVDASAGTVVYFVEGDGVVSSLTTGSGDVDMVEGSLSLTSKSKGWRRCQWG